MIRLKIDNREVSVPPGSTILDACEKLGIKIPTLCFLKELRPSTSCFICVVKLKNTGSLVPSCAYPAIEGMEIETKSIEILSARKTALDLLQSEHTGDCIAPCQKASQEHEDIPAMMRYIQQEKFLEAYRLVSEGGNLSISEKACRRGRIDEPVAIGKLAEFLRIKFKNNTRESCKNDYNGKYFSSIMRNITKEEMDHFLSGASSEKRVTETAGKTYSDPEAVRESLRCLHCDCRKKDACRLREFSEEHHSRQTEFQGERKPFTQVLLGNYIYEPGKCLSCGICTAISDKEGVKYGFTFLQRGFRLEVGFPLNKFDIVELNKILPRCSEKCPTGAISKR